MMQKIILSILMISILSSGFGQDLPAYKIFNKKGKSIKYSKMIKSLNEAEVILFGEEHDNPIAHWLQLELTKDISKAKDGKIMLGAEMYEADNQLILDEYLTGFMSEKTFKKEMRLWPNYKTDYKPVLDFAKENNICFIATNIPRRYANLVYRKGLSALDSLSDDAKKYIAPLPIKVDLELDAYKELREMGKQMGASHDNDNFPHSQAIKDATMGYFILKNLSKGTTFIHYNGSYHSDRYQSIMWYLKQQNSDLNIMTITTVSQNDVKELEEDHKNLADFTIIVPNSMTKTQ